jgi:hypothetical protein
MKEWREWNATEGAVEDIRRPLADGFSVAVHFKKRADARECMDQVYEAFQTRVKEETRQARMSAFDSHWTFSTGVPTED